jgi:CRISPR-associated protein Csd1
LAAAAHMLRDGEVLARLRTGLDERKAKPTDKITLRIDSDFPADSDSWHDWWRTFRRQLQTGKDKARKTPSAQMLCFLTGEPVTPAATHPKISGLTSVGGLAMGDVLVGFKQESFRSYGLEQSANAAMSELAAKGYQAGLNHLIDRHSVLLAGALVTHWFRDRIPEEDDLFDLIVGSKESQDANAQYRAHQLLESVHKGERVDLANNTYYALTLSSNGGRVVIRDWMEGSFNDLCRNIDRWFTDLEIVNREGSGSARPPKLAAVVASTVRDLKDAAPPMGVKLFRVAVRGEAIPLAAMAQALARARIDVIQGERPNHARMGLIKAYHLRKWRQEKGENVEPQLKP